MVNCRYHFAECPATVQIRLLPPMKSTFRFSFAKQITYSVIVTRNTGLKLYGFFA